MKWNKRSKPKIAESNCILFCWWRCRRRRRRRCHWTLTFHRSAILILIRMHWPISWICDSVIRSQWITVFIECHCLTVTIQSVTVGTLSLSAQTLNQIAYYLYIYIFVFQLYYCENMKFFCLIRDAQFFSRYICIYAFIFVLFTFGCSYSRCGCCFSVCALTSNFPYRFMPLHFYCS